MHKISLKNRKTYHSSANVVNEHRNVKRKNNKNTCFENNRLMWIPRKSKIVLTSRENLQINLSKENHSYYQIVTLGFNRHWTVHVMGSTLMNQRKILTHCMEHYQDSMKPEWHSQRSTEHIKNCHWQFKWVNPKTLAKSPKLYERNVHEAL